MTVEFDDRTAEKPPAPPTVKSEPPQSAMPDNALSELAQEGAAAFHRGAKIALTGLQGLPQAFGNSWRMLQNEERGVAHLGTAAPSAIVSGLAGAVLFLLVFHKALAFMMRPSATPPKALFAILRLAGDLVAIGIFYSIARTGVLMAMDSSSFARTVAIGFTRLILVGTIYTAFGRLLFAPIGTSGPLLEVSNPRWHFYMMTGFGFLAGFSNTSLSLADARGLDPMATDGWVFLSSTILTVYKLFWFISSRRDIAKAFAGKDAGSVRTAIAGFIADFYSASAILIWLLGFMVVGTDQNAIWNRAAGLSQLLIIITPIIDRAFFTLFRYLARKKAMDTQPGLVSTIFWTLPIPLSGAVWLIGLEGTILLWQPLINESGMDPAPWLGHIQKFAVAMTLSWTVCSFLWKYFETIAPSNAVQLPGQDDGHTKTTSRFSTMLPLLRNLILGIVAAVAVLAILQSAGVDIAPLLAGFGVLGLALSFGSQTLVKDVVSGIFFLAEDAFRIGEYIDTGKLKGTVEQISLRSIRLRHHNGPVHTIPFGQISAVTNFSRDWGTVKFELRFDREADLELIRKTAKKVGLAMLEEPEFGHEFLIPLKMQGIQEVNETSMVVRFKFTSRPGNPSLIKREGIKRLLNAFKAAGLNLASNAVVVRSGTGTSVEGAAASLATPVQAANVP
ncbi:mechanosensitive ion channel family protein [Rhizobium paknamense]|uniref:Small-conductance mechanosensitive channel n=1 Tax=Rhizobium paknamense TaxID=1206817 RepID=A0ABU0IDQ9_9HYPH|nr:mechanosensitive ion channel family protein [Rhizobium paknamense]MDQ0456376.1 small-conductance mechanosensitive channel [Rhizobium paknamense]